MFPSKRFIAGLPAALLALSMIGCTSSGGSGDDTIDYDAQDIIDNLVDTVIVPSYEELNTQAAALQTAAGDLDGSDLGDGELEAAQDAWKATRVPWESGEGFIFGPVDTLGIDPKLDTWPLNTSDLATATSGAGTYNSSSSEDIQGFHTAEYILFGNGTTNNDRSDEGELAAGEMNYLNGLMTHFASSTQSLVDAWDPASGDYAGTVKSHNGSTYASQGAVMEEFINGIIGIVDEVGNGKIADPFGSSLATADTTLVESQYSWNSLSDFHNNIQSVLNMYTGKKGFDANADTLTSTDDGLYAFVLAHDSQLADRVYDEIVDAMSKIALIDGDGDDTTTDISSGSQMPFREAIGDAAGRTRIQSAIDALATLQDSLENDVLPLLSETNFPN